MNNSKGGSTGTSEPGRVTVAGLAMASGRKMLGIMRAIETAGEGSVTANQSLTTDQILQAAAYLAAPEGAGTSEPDCPVCRGAGVYGSPGKKCEFCATVAIGKRYEALAAAVAPEPAPDTARLDWLIASGQRGHYCGDFRGMLLTREAIDEARGVESPLVFPDAGERKQPDVNLGKSNSAAVQRPAGTKRED